MEQFRAYDRIYDEKQERTIESEFQRIKDEHFLDHAGGTLYSEKQMANIFDCMRQQLFCNPHGGNGPSQQTEDAIDIIRFRILEHFHTNSEEYAVIFTANATAASKLVAENFDYRNGTFVYLEDNHTSVLGMRNFNRNIKPLKVDDCFNLFNLHTTYNCTDNLEDSNSLFVYPAQSNFSGAKYPLKWIEHIRNGNLNNVLKRKSKNWYVMLDAASFVSTSNLNLDSYKPDFVTISFYKIFGYPTGVGALLVRLSSQDVLKKTYFGGGTVLMALAHENTAIYRTSLSEKFEDGSNAFLAILAIKHGFDTLSRLQLNTNMTSKHTFSLAKYVYRNLITLHHWNGKPVAIVYSNTVYDTEDNQGGIVNFNLKRSDGRYVGYSEVMHVANLNRIHLRTGCSCNPGACQLHLQLETTDLKRHFEAGHVCGDQQDLVDGEPTGSVRISFGYMSTKKNADALLRMIEDCFVEEPRILKMPQNWQTSEKNKFSKQTNYQRENNKIRIERHLPSSSTSCFSRFTGILRNLLLYPIKSCGAFIPEESWKLSPSGLEYDRKWMIVNSSGSCVTQKHFQNLCLIQPFIDLRKNNLVLTYPGQDSITLMLHDPTRAEFRRCESKICRDKVIGFDCGDAVSQWLCRCLGSKELRLIEQSHEDITRMSKQGENLHLSFTNKSQYLMVNLASVMWLREKIRENNEGYSEDIDSMLLRFRPNIVVDFCEPFLENELECLKINFITFKTAGSCTRCQMICVNQMDGQKTKEPLATLARELNGKVQFGVYMCNDNYDINDRSIGIGSKVTL